MDFDQLITFLEVARQGSFSRAGEKVFRSQSAVSAQIRQLEQEYGDRLLDRSGKTVKLTPAGQVFHEYALRMRKLRDESLVAVADHGHTPRGTLMVGANEATCLYVLPDVFGEYCRRYPEVQISIYRNFSQKVVEKVEDGGIDVGIVTLPVKSPSRVGVQGEVTAITLTGYSEENDRKSGQLCHYCWRMPHRRRRETEENQVHAGFSR